MCPTVCPWPSLLFEGDRASANWRALFHLLGDPAGEPGQLQRLLDVVGKGPGRGPPGRPVSQARLGGGDGGLTGEENALLLLGAGVLPEGIQAAFGRVLRDLLALHGLSVQHRLFGAGRAKDAESRSEGR